jgi:LacI family transcriptional regulator
MAEKTKLEDVAQRAGVSLSTASMVLSDSGRISPLTKEKVLEAALALGYHRRPRKVEGAPAQARDIAILLDIDPEWAMVLYLIRPVIQEMERTLRQAGFNTVLIPISRSEAMADLLDKIRCSGAVGVATIHFASPELILYLESAGVPVVCVMNSSFQDRFYTVCVDDFQGAYEGSTYLIRAGHLRIGYVDCVRPDLPILTVDRFFGFKKAIEEYHLEFDQTMRRRLACKDEDEDRAALADLLEAHPDITAIFALDDDLAVRISVLLGKLGRQVPRDLSMIAPGDMLDYSLCYVPQMTTMRIDTAYMGRISAQMMINRLAHDPQELQVLKVKQHLMRRGTVRKLTE